MQATLLVVLLCGFAAVQAASPAMAAANCDSRVLNCISCDPANKLRCVKCNPGTFVPADGYDATMPGTVSSCVQGVPCTRPGCSVCRSDKPEWCAKCDVKGVKLFMGSCAIPCEVQNCQACHKTNSKKCATCSPQYKLSSTGTCVSILNPPTPLPKKAAPGCDRRVLNCEGCDAAKPLVCTKCKAGFMFPQDGYDATMPGTVSSCVSEVPCTRAGCSRCRSDHLDWCSRCDTPGAKLFMGQCSAPSFIQKKLRVRRN